MEVDYENRIDIHAAYEVVRTVANKTPLQLHKRLSEEFDCEVYLKREDLQVVRSYKIRGAYNFISQLTEEERLKGIVCASAGNHAQGVAYSCKRLSIQGTVYMPAITPRQKINQVKMFGGSHVDIVLTGDSFDECQQQALLFAASAQRIFVHPFDHPRIVEGQGTVAREIADELPEIDYLFVPVGGGGLCAGMGIYFQAVSPKTRLIGVEPQGAASMTAALKAGMPVSLDYMQRFVDGAAVKKVGEFTFAVCRDVLSDMVTVPEGSICSVILRLYNEDAIVAEPAGVLSIAALYQYKEKIKGKRVVCVLSGGNNDIDRMQEIKERSLLYEGLKHYFIIRFAQRPGALKEFVNNILGPSDDIVRFEFIQKHNKETGPALVGIEVKTKDDFQALVNRMNRHQLNYTLINQHENLFEYIV